MEYYLAASAVIGLIQSQKQAAMMRAQANAAEKMGKISEEEAEFQAHQAKVAGNDQATFIRRESMRKVGSMAATEGASGTDFKGSPIIVMGDQIFRDQMAAGTVVANASAKARSIEEGGEAAALSTSSNANSLRASANFTEEGGWLSVIAKGIGAAGAVSARTGGAPTGEGGFDAWYQGKTAPSPINNADEGSAYGGMDA